MASKHSQVDGSSAWVVMCAAVLNNFLVSVTYLSGIYNTVFLEEFQQSPSLTAWCAALHTSMFAFMGPVASILIHSIGYRKTVWLGGTCYVCGYLSCAFVTNFPMVFITYGFLAGAGSGLSFTPNIILVGYYFKRYRNLAFGIVTTSAGLSIMLMAPFIIYLIDEYGWRGSMIILSAVMSHVFACGMLLRPPNFEVDPNNLIHSITSINTNANLSSHNVSNKTTIDNSKNISPSQNDSYGLDISKEKRRYMKLAYNNQNARLRTESARYSNETYEIDSEMVKYPTRMASARRFSDSIESIEQRHNLQIKSDSKLKKIPTGVNSNSNNCKNTDKNISNGFYPNMHVTGYKALNTDDEENHQNLLHERTKMLNINSILSNMSSDFVAQSFMSINNLNFEKKDNQLNIEPETRRVDKFIDSYKLLINRKFIIFCINLIIADIGISCLYVHLPSFAIETGSTALEAGHLMSVVGLSTIFARLMCGLATNDSSIDVFLIYFGMCGVTGVGLCLGTVLANTSYIWKLFIAFVFGFYGNSFLALLSPMTISLLGLEALGPAYGMELLISGIGMLIGAPIAGLLYDVTGSYSYSLMLGGLAYLASALVMMVIPLQSKGSHAVAEK